MCVCVQDDLSEPLYEEDLDGSAGVLFPFYDPDTHMLYLAGKVIQHIHYIACPPRKLSDNLFGVIPSSALHRTNI